LHLAVTGSKFAVLLSKAPDVMPVTKKTAKVNSAHNTQARYVP
jgi:hypothetical protein